MSSLRLITADSWVIRLITNHVGYALFAIPMAALFLISKKLDYTTWPKPIRWFISPLIHVCISKESSSSSSDVENEEVISSPIESVSPSSNFTHHRFLKLSLSYIGLLIFSVIYGLLQERVMTRPYGDERFKNSQYVVFNNRLIAMIIVYLLLKIFYPMNNLTSMGPPLYRYGVLSYTRCMSIWFLYESLLYISVPVQVIANSIKIIPVMIIGKFVLGETYSLKQYLLMLIMATGIAFFLLGFHENNINKLSLKNDKYNITTLNGIIVLTCYLSFDAFASNYQKHLLNQYSIPFLNMMFFINLFSTILTLTSLILNGTLLECLLFMQRHHSFIIHVLLGSICFISVQLLTFSIMKELSIIMFTILLTMRPALRILLSCIVYGHQLTWIAILGLHIAFLAIFIHGFMQFKKKKQPNNTTV